MKKRVVFLLIVLWAIIFSYKMGLGFGKEKDELYKELEIFSEGLAVIEKEYVEDKSAQDLIYGAMEGMLMSLDSYSQFLTPDDYKNLLVETGGKFGGLGIEITIRDGLLTVVSPIEDTPAWNAGIKAGDVIIKIEGELTKGITLNDAVKKMRGKPGTKITLTILKEESKDLEDIILMRDIINIKDIKRAIILEDNIGYVRIAEFRENTAIDLDKSLLKLEKDGLKALIIDVRNNPGGLLSSAIDIVSRFTKEEEIIVSTKSRNEPEKMYKSQTLAKKYLDIPIVVLINKGSASGSEILASALRENNRAILLGEKTFGKGSVQTIVPLSDGSALRLTTSKYYTPDGKSIHEKGVEPDIIVSKLINEDAKKDVFEELKEERSEESDYRQDYQIIRALDLIRGLLVLSEKQQGT